MYASARRFSAAGLVASWIPAHDAARVDPVECFEGRVDAIDGRDPEAGTFPAETSDDDGPTQAVIPTTEGPPSSTSALARTRARVHAGLGHARGYSGMRGNVADRAGTGWPEWIGPTRRPLASWSRRCRTRTLRRQ